MTKRLSDDVDRGDVVEDVTGRYHVVISRKDLSDGTRGLVTVGVNDPRSIPKWVSEAIKHAEKQERSGKRPAPIEIETIFTPPEGGTEGETSA